MKLKSVFASAFRIVLACIWALLLLLAGVLGLLYSSWAQDLAREALIAKFNNGNGTELSLKAFRLSFPAELELSGLAMSQNGDTIVAAQSLKADVALLPLLTGRAKVEDVSLTGAAYVMGKRDSATYINIAADTIALPEAVVKLASMDISLPDGTISGGRFSIIINPDTAVSQPSEQTAMSINVGKLALNNFDFDMRLMPTIDTLSAHICRSELRGADIKLLEQQIKISSFSGLGLDARYIVPDSAAIALAGPYPQPSASQSAPWTVSIDSLDFADSHALYTTAGVKPMPGLDFAYIEVSDMNLAMHDFFNQTTTVRLPLQISATERCGVHLDIDGTLDIDSVALNFKDIALSTPQGTKADFSGTLGMGSIMTDKNLPLAINLDGAFAPADLSRMFPAFSPYFAAIPSADDILLNLVLDGTSGKINLDKAALKLNNCVNLLAEGTIVNITDPDNLAGDITLNGSIVNVDSFKKAFLDPATAKSFEIPPMNLSGQVAMNAGNINGNLTARTGKGALRMNALWNSKREDYKLKLATTQFPVNAFMPLLEVGQVTADMNVSGHGYSPFLKSTVMNADVNLASAEFRETVYSNIRAKASLAQGQAVVTLDSDNPGADFSLAANGNLAGDTYTWHAELDGRYIDLYELKMAEAPASVETTLSADATIGPGKNDVQAHLILTDLFYRREQGTIGISDADVHFNANDSLTDLRLTNRDLAAAFTSPEPISDLTTRFSKIGTIISDQMKAFYIDADTLRRTLPPFALDITGGYSNLVNDILATSKMSLRSFAFNAGNDSTFTINGFAKGIDTGSMRLDSVFVNGNAHGSHFHLNAGLENKPGNMNEWHKVNLNGVVDGNKLSLALKQQNLKGETGFDFGLLAEANAADTCLTVHVSPYNPVIGYRQWTANEDNFISYTVPTRHIDANLRMQGGNSSLAIYTEHAADSDEHSSEQEDLIVKLGDIHLSDWIAVNPFAPPIKGDVNADMRLNRHGGILTGQGSAGITNFTYGKERVADFKADFDVAATPSGTIKANADLLVNGVKTMTLSGALNDSTSTSPLNMDFAMIRFPLQTANPFLPPSVGRLRGMLNGSMKISGTSEAPVFNGTLDFDSTAVKLALTGTEYAFSNTPLPVEDNMVHFDKFAIDGCNDSPLTVNGYADISKLDNVKMNLDLKADNMMIVNSTKAAKGADIFGKAYISLDANAHGSMQLLNVNANLSVNPGTNVTYIIPDATSAISNRSNEDMVKFVNFTDSAAVLAADSIRNSGMALFLDATLRIEEGTTLNVYLSADGKNRAQIQSNGTLTYAMTPLDNGRLSGRININSGYVRYTPPLMSEKLFNFEDGSYVAFTGNMMNPTLNIHATDVLKANVTQEGQNSRLVNFNVMLGVTGTLENMNVKFDLSTNDDITVANELESMSAEQRANQAMNLLLYNVYTGPGTKANASLSGNPLFSFLESQLNSWAANTIKGVDISFGIDQYDRTVNGSTSSTMSYSYQVSKSLFNDRFKIVVGGNYSTDANADENFSQNLINDISFEYFLNNTHTMYVRLFRHTGYESILEGEITQTGVGFVYTRKLRKLLDMFLPAKLVKARLQKEREAESNIKNNETK